MRSVRGHPVGAIIRHTRNVITDLGYQVLYGDTDSCGRDASGNPEETIAGLGD